MMRRRLLRQRLRPPLRLWWSLDGPYWPPSRSDYVAGRRDDGGVVVADADGGDGIVDGRRVSWESLIDGYVAVEVAVAAALVDCDGGYDDEEEHDDDEPEMAVVVVVAGLVGV